MEPTYVQLPRNFAFFERLPTRFKLLVLGPGKPHAEGFWYPVIINGHKLNVFSTELLKAEHGYQVEKRSQLKLRLISPGLQESAQNDLRAEKIPAQFNQEQSLSGDFLFEFFGYYEILSLLVQNQTNGLVDKKSDLLYSFPLHNEYSGLFLYKPDLAGYQLFLPSDLIQASEIDHILSLLADCGVKKIELLPQKTIQSMSRGLRIEG